MMQQLRILRGMVRESPFLKHNAVFFLGSLVVSFLNYLYYPVLGRMLSPADFGEVQALLSLFLQAAIFLNILTYVTIHITVNSKASERNALLLGMEKVAIIAGYALLGIALLATPALKAFLNFHEVWPFVALIAALAISVPLIFRMAYLRGKKLFFKAAFTDGIGSFSKLILSIILVAIGWRAFGAMAGLALSQIISLAFGVTWARKHGFRGFGLFTRLPNLTVLKPQLTYAGAVFLASFSVTALSSLDIIAIKHYFPPEEAGLYAGVTTVARIIFFLVAPFTGVLLTMVSLKQSPLKNNLQLGGTLGLIALLGGVSFAAIATFPAAFINLLVGSKYLALAELLPRISLAMLLLALSNALLMYHVALRRYAVAFFAVIVFVLTLCLVYWNNDTAGQIVTDILFGSILLLILTLGYTAAFFRLPRE